MCKIGARVQLIHYGHKRQYLLQLVHPRFAKMSFVRAMLDLRKVTTYVYAISNVEE